MRREKHIAFGEAAIDAYTAAVGGNDEQTTLGDLIADLHHYADARGLDWLQAADDADRHYEGDPTEPDFA